MKILFSGITSVMFLPIVINLICIFMNDRRQEQQSYQSIAVAGKFLK